jgi:hypothetical protein
VGLPDRELRNIVGRDPLKKSATACTRDSESAHVADVEEAGLAPDSVIFVDDAGVLDGHFPAGKVNEFAAVGTMLFNQGCLFHE